MRARRIRSRQHARLFIAIVLAGATGCGSMRLRPTNPDHIARKAEVVQKLGSEPAVDSLLKAEQKECDALDNRVTAWSLTALAAGVLSGAGGISSALPEDSSAARWGIGGATLVVGVLGAIAGYMAPHDAALYSHRCAINTGGK